MYIQCRPNELHYGPIAPLQNKLTYLFAYLLTYLLLSSSAFYPVYDWLNDQHNAVPATLAAFLVAFSSWS